MEPIEEESFRPLRLPFGKPASYQAARGTHHLLHPVQFEHAHSDETHEINAYHAETGEHIGQLDWARKKGFHDKGEIESVWTHPDFRRGGIATAMYDVGRQGGYKPRPEHSPNRTDAGEAWAAGFLGTHVKRYS